MNAQAYALAHGTAHAMCDRSVHAKRSEVKSPDLPDLKFLSRYYKCQSFSDVSAEPATLDTCEANHG